MVRKTKRGQRLVRVKTQIAHGSSKRVARELSRLGFSQANTSAIERRNGTARGMDATSVRIQRIRLKTLAFAKTADPANPSLTRRVLGAWGVLIYNWARECRSLKRPLAQPQGRQLYERRPPAMAAGLIQRIRPSDQIWSVRELQGRIRWIRSPTYPGRGAEIISRYDRLLRAPPFLQVHFLFYRFTVEDFRRRPVSQGLMGPPVVVEPEVFSQPSVGLKTVGVGLQVDLLVLHRLPQPFDEDVVLVPAPKDGLFGSARPSSPPVQLWL